MRGWPSTSSARSVAVHAAVGCALAGPAVRAAACACHLPSGGERDSCLPDYLRLKGWRTEPCSPHRALNFQARDGSRPRQSSSRWTVPPGVGANHVRKPCPSAGLGLAITSEALGGLASGLLHRLASRAQASNLTLRSRRCCGELDCAWTHPASTAFR
jgi:hypothetical protein